MANRLRTPVVAVLTAIAAVLALPGPARAHAIVQSSSPGAGDVVESSPAAVEMEFNEPVEIAFGAVKVYDTTGDRVDDGEADYVEGRPDAIRVALEPDLPDGTYTVTWRVVSADSHVIEEAFVFHVGAPGERPQGIASQVLEDSDAGTAVEVAAAAVRWASFASLLLLAGALAFGAAIWRPRGTALATRPPGVEERFATRSSRLAELAWIGAVVSTALAFVLQGAVAGGVSVTDALGPGVLSEVAGTRFGTVMLVRLVLLLAGAAAWVVAGRAGAVARSGVAPRRAAGSSAGAAAVDAPAPAWVLAGGGLLLVALLATPGLAGHAGTTPPVALNLLADVAHMVAAAVWVGGLATLALAAFPATRDVAAGERARVMAPVVRRFSQAALVMVAILVVTGAYRSWVEVQALRALTGSAYGVVLLTKIGLFLPLLALGAYNHRVSRPRLEEEAAARDEGPALGRLRRVVVVESVVAVLVLGVTAFLVNLPPARVEAGVTGPFSAHALLGDHHLSVLVTPNVVGENEVHLTATDPSGAPARIKEMQVFFRMPQEDIGPLVADGKELAEGHFIVQGSQLAVPGEWEIEVVARTGRFTEARATVDVTVNG